jgi:hypothetical protein
MLTKITVVYLYHNYKNIKQIPKNKDLVDSEKYVFMMGYESVHT